MKTNVRPRPFLSSFVLSVSRSAAPKTNVGLQLVAADGCAALAVYSMNQLGFSAFESL